MSANPPLHSRARFLFWGAYLMLAAALVARADCTVTNLGLKPLNDLGFGVYKGFTGGLYPSGSNQRPPVHDLAGMNIAKNEILPRDAVGTVNTNSGKIVLLSIGLSNTTQEWASKGTNTFMNFANADPSKNPQVLIVDGAQGGQATDAWTNINAPTWTVVLQRLTNAGVTTNQVQAVWLKLAQRTPATNGLFPLHAQSLQRDLDTIVRDMKLRFPNLKLTYLASRTRAYDTNSADLNPEPFAYESGFSMKWLIETQLNGGLNFDTNKGPVVAPWLAWGPYLWADGTTPRSDGFTWLCSDLEGDFTHPSTNGGVPKVAQQLLNFFKTDPTTAPWFLRKTVTNLPPTCAPTASATNGLMPLAVNFAANASDPDGTVTDTRWTFDDGTFSTNANPVKTFPASGTYIARLAVTDNSGNVVTTNISVNVTTTFDLWRAAKFTAAELTNANISGAGADPDGDGLPNLLEYVLGLEPKTPDSFTAAAPQPGLDTNGFKLTYRFFKAATDVTLAVEATPDFSDWNSGGSFVQPVQTNDLGPTQSIVVRDAAPFSATLKDFFHLRATK
ncbi:MAG: PKD domain-containing protein [Verrucomicrobia bacterium]|nr:PKD domain-containing protein [Verrucomicrobiota bacterium]